MHITAAKTFGIITAAAIIACAISSAYAQQGNACTSGVRAGYKTGTSVVNGNNLNCVSNVWQYPAYTMQSAAAAAGSSCSGYTAGAMRYNTTISNVEYCNGTIWSSVIATQGSLIAPTTPASPGYFVLTSTTYNGNLGGAAGANAKCYTELTTNTAWMGYSTANSNGQLTQTKINAWLGSWSYVTSLMPMTRYYFARVGDATAGGASFYTNSTGYGPYTSTAGSSIDSSNWSGNTYFKGSYNYWGARGPVTCGSDDWGNGYGYTCSSGGPDECIEYTSSSGSDTGALGVSNSTGHDRYNSDGGATAACNTSQRLVCFVNP